MADAVSGMHQQLVTSFYFCKVHIPGIDVATLNKGTYCR